MKEITAFQTTDGALFHHKYEAEEHEWQIDLRNRLTEFWVKHITEFHDTDDFINTCMEHREELLEILQL